MESERIKDERRTDSYEIPRASAGIRTPINLSKISIFNRSPHGSILRLNRCIGSSELPLDIDLPEISLGHSVCHAHGIVPDREEGKEVYVVQNFVAPRRFGSGDLVHVDPCPQDSKPLNLLAIPCLYPGERALVTPPQPGMVDYFVSRGIIESIHQVDSVFPPFQPGIEHSLAFDPLSLARRQGRTFEGNLFVSAFSSDFIRRHALSLGFTPIQASDAFLSNNKAEFHSAADRLGISKCKAIVLKSERDLDRVVAEFGAHKVWCKYSNGFGGDMLCSIPGRFDRSTLRSVINALKDTCRVSILTNGFGNEAIQRIWPSSELLPCSGEIVVEADISQIGRKIIEGSCVMKVHSSGFYRVEGYFQQITDQDGHFLGSTSLDPRFIFGADFFARLEIELKKVAEHCRELSLFGLVGVDFMVVRTEEDNLVPVIIELNGRPPMSACSHIVGSQKLRAPHWMSVAMWAQTPIHDYYDLAKALKPIGGERILFQSPQEGGIVPMILGSIGTKSPFGDYRTIHSRRWCNLILAGTSPEHSHEIRERLQLECGFTSTPPSTGW